jgi:hypothetical protein
MSAGREQTRVEIRRGRGNVSTGDDGIVRVWTMDLR